MLVYHRNPILFLAAMCCATLATQAGIEPPTQVGQRIDVDAALAGARIVGLADQIELIVPLPMNDEARAIGAVGRQVSYKGVCGPDGAPATPGLLLAHARRDLERMNNPSRGDVTVIYGVSPKFSITYDPTDVYLPLLFLPSFQTAASYVDSRLDDRIEIRINLSTADIPGNVIGSAGSATYLFDYETYRQGLRAADNRQPEESDFANALRAGTLPVIYDNSGTTSAEPLVVANATQIRAIFGDNVIGQDTAISITLDNTANWDYSVYFDDLVDPGKLSLVDAAVHEITHGLGFRSEIRSGGNNPDNRVAGLDIARFRFLAAGIPGGVPLFTSEFTVFPRWGDNFTVLDPSIYSRPSAVFPGIVAYVALEGGRFNLQPSHLEFRENFNDKIGLMDPVLALAETYGPNYWGFGEDDPLNDMGWKIIRPVDTLGDCDGNGFADILDILGFGRRDADGDFRLDDCELFYDNVSIAGTYPSRITETIYDANGATSLSQFDPNVNPVLNRRLVTSLDVDYTSNEDDTVRVFSGFIFAPAPDEYSFRVGHKNAVKLEIAAETFLLFGERNLNGLTNPSLPVFIQLEQGWHAFKMTALISEPGPFRLTRESRSIGGWGPVFSEEFAGTFFVDCDGNGNDDQFEPRGDINAAAYVGVAGTASDLLEFGTCNSPAGFQFDTEIAIWDADGDLVAQNDDAPGCNTTGLSRLSLTLPAGEYFIGIAGYNALFSDGFGVDFPADVCLAGGSFVLRVGSQTVTSEVDPGKVKFVRFSIGPDSCPADLAAPFGTLNFFDISAFIGLFNAGDLEADFAAPFGSLNFFDVAEYIAQFNAGCP